ncbi:MAG: ABC transporter ATP-binding protein [Clostridia bacterium]|nr:ABC transporter ATP-binding protein [Clostridia bacterium]
MIRAEKVAKKFGDFYALKDLSCEIQQGSIYGLVGANGAGKSTLLRLISGVYKADEGRILIDGEPVYNNPEVKGRIAFVADDVFFLPHSDLMRMKKLHQSAYPSFDEGYFFELCNRFKLDRNKSLSAFSKGMRRQAALILALASRPSILLMDETFDGLDPIMRNLIKTIIYETMVDRSMTVVLSSHSLRELEDTCDQLSLLYKGGIVFESDVQNLKTRMFKVQIAFSEPFDGSRFQGFELINYVQHGRVANFILKGDREEARAKLDAMQPLLLELLPLSLEEVFVHEMDALGYEFSSEMKEGV